MRWARKRGSTSNIVRVFIPDNSVTNGAGLTGLTNSSTNLVIAYIREKDSAATTYTGANIETISAIGTFAAPSSSSKVRFKAVDATNVPGLYELQFHDSATAFGSADTSNNVIINIYETSTTALHIGPNAVQIPLVATDFQDGNAGGMAYLDAAVTSRASAADYTSGRAAALDNLDAAVSTRSTYNGGAVASVTGAVGSVTAAVTVSDKTGYKLASDGLDSVSTTAPSGVASNFREMLVQLWRRGFRKVVKDKDTLTIKTYADDGTTVVTTQAYTDNGLGNESQGAAS